MLAAAFLIQMERGFGEEFSQAELTALLALLAVVLLLTVPNALAQWRRFRHPHEEP